MNVLIQIKMSMRTANGKYSYSDNFRGISVHEWVQECHSYMCDKYGWKTFPILPGAFGYDNLVISLHHLFEKLDNSEEDMAEAVHAGWTENYLYWRDNKPWETDGFYRKPGNSLGDTRRNTCASTQYRDLPEEEKEKDIVVVNFVLEYLKKL
jgi:hypothetical protein